MTIATAAPLYDSVDVGSPTDRIPSGVDVELPNICDDCGWDDGMRLENPEVIKDPFGKIGQYNDLSGYPADRLAPSRGIYNDVLIGVEYQNASDLFESSMGFIQEMYDIAMDGSTAMDVQTGLFGPTLTFDKQGNLRYFEHVNGYGARKEDTGVGDKSYWTYFYKDTSGNYHEVGYDEFSENAGGVFSGILHSIGETINDIGEGISNFFSGLFSSDIIVKPGAEESDGHLGGIFTIDSMSNEYNYTSKHSILI